MERRLGLVLAGMGGTEYHKQQEDVFEDALEADMPSAQGLGGNSAETQQVG